MMLPNPTKKRRMESPKKKSNANPKKSPTLLMNGKLNKPRTRKRKQNSILEKLEKAQISILNGKKPTPTKKKRKRMMKRMKR